MIAATASLVFESGFETPSFHTQCIQARGDCVDAQVMSITETQYSGASVIVISPDSDNLSVLQVENVSHSSYLHRWTSLA